VVSGGLWKLFERVEKVASPTAKANVADWLRAASPERASIILAASFTRAFDAAFGRRHLSLKCFLRSSLASFVYTTSLFLLWWSYQPNDHWLAIYDTSSPFAVALVGTLTFSLLPDYLALLKTRAAIGLAEGQTPGRQRILFLVDTALSASISLAWAVVFYLSREAASGHFPWPDDILYWSRAVLNDVPHFIGADPDRYSPPFWIYFYSTMLSSFWLLLYITSARVIRLGQTLSGGWFRTVRLLDLERQPFLSLGVVSIALMSVLYCLAAPFIMLWATPK
jgi:hypothetical protein